MTNLQLRIPLGVGQQLQEIIHRSGSSEGPHEYIAFGLIGHAKLDRGDLLLLREVHTIPDEAYIRGSKFGASWRGAAMLPILQRAMDERLGIVLIHAHDHTGMPKLSGTDRASADRLVPMFRQRVPERPHGSLVFSRTNASGIVFMPGEKEPQEAIAIRWLGSSILDWPARGEATSGDESYNAFQRQALVVGDVGQSVLKAARVAVVGLSGGGSHAVAQLSKKGIGEIVIIDEGRVKRSHQHRLMGLTGLDILLKRKKVDIARREIRRAGTGSKCIVVEAKVPGPNTIEALKNADIIVAASDNLHARREIQEISTRFLIPFIDIGARIREVPNCGDGPRVAVSGNILTIIPGGFCMWCCGFLTKEKLESELDAQGYFQNRDGEAQVVTFNGLLASQACSEVLQLLTGFAGTSIRVADLTVDQNNHCQRGFRKLDGVKGTLVDWGANRRSSCSHCNSVLAQGNAIWRSVS